VLWRSHRRAFAAGALAGGPLTAAAQATDAPPENVAPPGLVWAAGTWLHGQVLGVPLWEYLAFLLYLVLALYLARLADYAIQALLRRWAARSSASLDDLLMASLHRPLRAISFILLLQIGLGVFAWPKWSTTFVATGLKLLIAGSVTYLALKLVDLLMVLWRRRMQAAEDSTLDLHLLPLLRNSLKIIVLIVAVLVTSQNLGLNVTSLLASLSIGGLAVGLAAQDTLSNLFGSVAIFADKPFRVGDHIQLDSIEGMVETIGLRSTRVRNLDGFLVTIPNKTMASSNIFNISKRRGIRTVLDIGVSWDTPAQKLERAIALINEVFRPHPRTADLLVSVNTFDSAVLNIRLIHWWDSNSLPEYLLGFQELNLELKRRLYAEGLGFGAPSQTVYVRQATPGGA
jgi:MscS family membrane protein